MEKYALYLDSDSRILSVTYDEFAPPEYPRVSELPSGDVTDYKYVNEQFIHSPRPHPPQPPQPPEPGDTSEEIIRLNKRVSNLERNAVYNVVYN